MEFVLVFILLVQIYHQFDHEYLNNLVADPVPVGDFLLIIMAVLLFQVRSELLEPEVNIESHLDIFGIDIHHHMRQHQRLLHQVLVFKLPMLELNLFVHAQCQELF